MSFRTIAITVSLLSTSVFGEELPKYELYTTTREHDGVRWAYRGYKIDRSTGVIKYCTAHFDPNTKKGEGGCGVRVSKSTFPDLAKSRMSVGGEKSPPTPHLMLGFINTETGAVTVCWPAVDICTALKE